MISEKHKNVCRALKHFQHFVAFVYAVSRCVSASVFASLVGVPVRIASSAVELKICALTAGIKKYNSIIKKKRKKHNKILLLAKAKIHTIEISISTTSIDSYINHDEFVSIKDVNKVL